MGTCREEKVASDGLYKEFPSQTHGNHLDNNISLHLFIYLGV